ncbi:MAG: pantoate--beta-alanine ligase [Gammaproteobacteria bacterium]|nr:MAG: pantoate--beta-alanine ligase [Gammaproteobacteria bacterium]
MHQFEQISTLQTQVKKWRQQNKTIAFVPTMGNLHLGHLSLLEKAKQLADKVIVSIFVNPLQFDDKADLNAYPRTLDADMTLLLDHDCDVVFTPSANVMYPNGMDVHTTISVPNMDDKLCGLNRPGHFDGVATVVAKFLNIVQADWAIFGEKDYQQLSLINRMATELNLSTQIVSGPTLREDNGLAMSSRNQYLTSEQRSHAAHLYRILQDVKARIELSVDSFDLIQQQAMSALTELGFVAEYLDIRRTEDLDRADRQDKSLVILVAARLGKARLIDNITCDLA